MEGFWRGGEGCGVWHTHKTVAKESGFGAGGSVAPKTRQIKCQTRPLVVGGESRRMHPFVLSNFLRWKRRLPKLMSLLSRSATCCDTVRIHTDSLRRVPVRQNSSSFPFVGRLSPTGSPFATNRLEPRTRFWLCSPHRLHILNLTFELHSETVLECVNFARRIANSLSGSSVCRYPFVNTVPPWMVFEKRRSSKSLSQSKCF